MGGITEIATSAPGYNSLRPNNCAPLAETLKLNGYSTAQFGKCHEVPVWESSAVGPFDHWPHPGGGFEYFYGFIGGETNQWYPAIYENTSPVEPWGTPEAGLPLHGRHDREGHRLDEASRSRSRRTSRSSPTSPPARRTPRTTCRRSGPTSTRASSTRAGTRSAKETFARQKELGVVAADAMLTERSPGIPAWDEMSDELQAGARAPDGGLRRATSSTPTTTSACCSTRSKSSASSTTPSST